MANLRKPFWWEDLAAFYHLYNPPGDTFSSDAAVSDLNALFVPASSHYIAHKSPAQAVATDPRIDIAVLTAGNDAVFGQGSGDFISGKAGDDILYGDGGHDIIHGGAGADLIVGRTEGDAGLRDAASYVDAPGAVTVTLVAGATGMASNDGYGDYDFLIGIDDIIGSDQNDIITAQGEAANRLLGGLGNDTVAGGNGNDTLVGGTGNDTLRGESGNDVIISGKGADQIFGGAGRDTIVFDPDTSVDIIHDFQVGSNGDRLDVSALLRDYQGTDPLADGTLRLVQSGSNVNVEVNAHNIATLNGVNASQITSANFVTSAKKIFFAAILGQSNAKGLSTAGEDRESGVTHLRDGLKVHTGYDEVISVQREPGTNEAIDIAVGGTTVDGNRNTNLGPDRVWWYPDQNRPGELLYRAVDMLQTQIAEQRARGVVTPVIVWGQGEAETRNLGRGASDAISRYKQGTLAVFDYIREHLGGDIQFYIMQTGRFSAEGARNAGLSESGVQQTLRGTELIHVAQQDIALSRDDVHLAADYSDLRMLYEVDPVTWAKDQWHIDYEDREIIGDRLADFIAADLGYTHVIRNPGHYPSRMLADIRMYAPENPGSAPATPSALNGTDGDDRLVGASTGNMIDGRAGVDKLIATGGENILIGGLGKDSLTLGPGHDRVVFGAEIFPDVLANADFISRFQAGAGGDELDVSGLLSAVDYHGDDPIADGLLRLSADGTRTKIHFDADGFAGPAKPVYLATLDGVTPAEFSKTDNLVIHPEAPAQSTAAIDGTSGKDLIIGTTGDDVIHGLGGADTILAGPGADRIFGGTGRDTFVFRAALDYADVIEDFTGGAGGDYLDISLLLETAGYTGDDPAGDGYIAKAVANGVVTVTFDGNGHTAGGAETLAILRGAAAASFDFDSNLATADRPIA